MIDVLNKLKNVNLTISIAESMTGGALSSEITKIPGASKVFKGSIVAYSAEAKINILNIDSRIIDKYSVVSSEVATAMIKGLASLLTTDIYISVTGNAGPGFDLNTREFKYYVGIRYENNTKIYHQKLNSDNRTNNIKTVIRFIKNKLLEL